MLKIMLQPWLESKSIFSRLGLFMALPAILMLIGCSGGDEESSTENAATSEPQEIPAKQAKKDPNKIQFLQCAACHGTEAGAPTKVGPNLHCVINRPAGAVPDFKYSNAFKEAASKGLVWDTESLSAFIANSKAVVPKNTMAFNGVADEEKRRKIIDYIATQCRENNG